MPVSLNLADGDALVLATEGAIKTAARTDGATDETAFLRTVLACAKQGTAGLAERVVDAVAAKAAPIGRRHDLTVVTAVRTRRRKPR